MQWSGLLKFKNIGIRKIELVAKIQLFNQYIYNIMKSTIKSYHDALAMNYERHNKTEWINSWRSEC